MAVPKYSDIMLPLLQFAGDGRNQSVKEAINAVAEMMGVTEEDRMELLPSGSQRTLDNRTHWAKTYLIKAGLLESTGRGMFQITERGRRVLESSPEDINLDYLRQFPEFVEFTNRTTQSQVRDNVVGASSEGERTPKEQMYSLNTSLQEELASELLEYVLAASPAFFERMVIDLLLAMGYGGSLQDAGASIGRSGDEGIDGYIQEDKLGLSTIYVQAKRWTPKQTVGRPTVQAFVGSLMGAGATKGVFITTSGFSEHARDYAETLQNLKVILINGTQLTRLMIEHDIGVAKEQQYVVKRVDTDYFDYDSL